MTPKVIVIGAGTGGMCLAHGLRRAGVDVAVYERDRTRADGLYGYRVGIDADGSRALRECLPPDLYDTFVATCARPPRFFNVYTEKLRRTASFALPDTADEHSVSRMTLRQVLLTGMDDVVRFDKTFTHFTRHDDGTVTAHFADGTSDTGTLLVGADGTRSAVRRQYLPHATVRDAGVTAVTAKVPITAATRALLPPEAFEGLSLLFAPKGFFGILHVMEFKWDRDGTVKNGIGGNDAELIARWPGLLYDNTRDYINWGISAATRRFPADVLDLRGEPLKRLVLDLTPGWHPHLRRLFELAEPDTCFPVRIATSEPVPPWETSAVTLLGDAIHTMTPGGGVGANTALRDAAMLCRQLATVQEGRRDLRDAVAAYEADMIEYGFGKVAASLEQNGTSGDDPLHKPVIGRIMLAVTRAFFRTVDLVPPLKRRFLANLYAARGADPSS
jgi:2-polyprenyl-6-methoxyphenol hydroxylase-like FAD-dependent oxidoreductase